jgi:hypothetical protein
MSVNIFISFRADDGIEFKNELNDLFDKDDVVRNYSEDKDRSNMTENTIQTYLYSKLSKTSITIVILSPNAVNYRKNSWNGKYDDWMYDELRFSLEDRENNRTNGVIALYTSSATNYLFDVKTHKCMKCNAESKVHIMKSFDNLVRKNMMNVKSKYKVNQCDNVYDSMHDSYISLVNFDDFKKNYMEYISNAIDKRNRIDEFEITKRL